MLRLISSGRPQWLYQALACPAILIGRTHRDLSLDPLHEFNHGRVCYLLLRWLHLVPTSIAVPFERFHNQQPPKKRPLRDRHRQPQPLHAKA